MPLGSTPQAWPSSRSCEWPRTAWTAWTSGTGRNAASSSQWEAATFLTGHPDHRAVDLAEGLRVARNEGLTNLLYLCMSVCAARVARNDDIETAAVLLAGSARHADPLGMGRGNTLSDECRARARAAVDAHSGELTAARHCGDAMTIDELVDLALETLA